MKAFLLVFHDRTPNDPITIEPGKSLFCRLLSILIRGGNFISSSTIANSFRGPRTHIWWTACLINTHQRCLTISNTMVRLPGPFRFPSGSGLDRFLTNLEGLQVLCDMLTLAYGDPAEGRLKTTRSIARSNWWKLTQNRLVMLPCKLLNRDIARKLRIKIEAW